MTRKPKPKPLVVISGWFEILFRFRPLPVLRSFDDLDPDDYMMIGKPMPLVEFDGPYEAYTVISDDHEAIGLPRAVREYDVLSMIYQADGKPEVLTTNILLIDDRGSKNFHLIYDRASLQWGEPYPLTQLVIPGIIFPSYIRP